jgi:REP element-mobilizing transposase RayT
MTVRRKIAKGEGIYFITITCHNWIPLFEIANAYQSVFNWFDALKRDGNNIAAFVIMPNHIHVLIHIANTSKSVNQYVSNGKRFMAYEIVQKLRDRNLEHLLIHLKNNVNDTQKKLGKLHQVFEPSFECKVCATNAFTLQKLNYIHSNPIKGKWQLATHPIDYKYSSMKQYETGEKGIYEVTLLPSIECFSFL